MLSLTATGESGHEPLSTDELQLIDTWWRAAFGPRDTAWIQKQNTAALLIARHVRVTMQHNIHLVRRMRRRNMLQAELQTATPKIGNQRPLVRPVTVAAHDCNLWSDRAQLVENVFGADVPEVPALVRVARKIDN